jgi:dephospho-CoA kinase
VPAIGITGGISTGKTTLVECLRQLLPAAKFFDADGAAHALFTDPDARNEIVTEFGSGVYSASGDLNRAALRAIVFQDAAKRRALEQILHPRIRRQWSVEAQNFRNSPDFFFADIPLLYETGGETLCNRVVVVACAPGIQLLRLRQRKSIGQTEAEQMINSQMSLTEKIARADHVVWNDGGRDLLAEQAKLLVDLWRTK